MRGDFYDDFIPWSVNSENLNLRDYRDLLNLGKENLQFLARFWRKRAEKMRAKINDPSVSYQDRERFEHEANEATRKTRELRKIIEDAESKPCLFEKTTFETGTNVVIFQENPDRFVSGVIAKIKPEADDDEAADVRHATFLIRPQGFFERNDINYAPDGFTLFTANDFEYFKSHIKFFRLYLHYFTNSIPDRDKVERMLACMPSPLTPPDAD